MRPIKRKLPRRRPTLKLGLHRWKRVWWTSIVISISMYLYFHYTIHQQEKITEWTVVARNTTIRHQHVLSEGIHPATRYDEFSYRAAQPRHHDASLKECGDTPDFANFFQQTFMSRSSRNEDKFIYDTFFRSHDHNRAENGGTKWTYVELGAFNGKRESNTRFFDLCLEWNGLLIEANPLKYPKLLENRPHAHCLNFAPSCISRTRVAFHSVAFTNAAQANVVNEYSQDNATLVNVPCDRLSPVVQDILGGSVTLFVLDVEGAENQVLLTVDFKTIHVDIWVVENSNNFCPKSQPCQSRDETRDILNGAGYVGYQNLVPSSDLFVFPDSAFQKLLEHSYTNLSKFRIIQ